MAAHVPITPRRASEIINEALINPLADVLADFAEAGLVKGYARVTETVHPDGRREEVRDRRIPRDLWRRIISEGKVADLASGTVRLAPSPAFGGGPRVSLIGIRFDDQSVRDLASKHGQMPAEPPEATVPVVPVPQPVKPADGDACEMPKEAAATRASEVDHGPLFQSPAKPVTPARRSALADDAKAVTVDRAAELLSIGRTKLYDMAKKGDLIIIKVGRRSLIPMSEIDRLLGSSIE